MYMGRNGYQFASYPEGFRFEPQLGFRLSYLIFLDIWSIVTLYLKNVSRHFGKNALCYAYSISILSKHGHIGVSPPRETDKTKNFPTFHETCKWVFVPTRAPTGLYPQSDLPSLHIRTIFGGCAWQAKVPGKNLPLPFLRVYGSPLKQKAKVVSVLN